MVFRLSLLLLISFAASAEETAPPIKPLWELGLLAGGVETSDYPGSNESQFRWLLFPNFRYRGSIFRADESEGTRARLYHHEVYKLDLSFDFNFPIDSDQNQARSGMEDVDLVFEIGPRLKIRLHHFANNDADLYLILPLRKSQTLDFNHMGDAGWSFSPGIQYMQNDVFCSGCLFFTRINASFFDSKNSDTFYQVKAVDVTSTRTAFEGRAGYNSVELFTGYVLQVGKVQGFVGIVHNHFGGSVNKQSPLLVSDNNTTVILGLGWLFWQSDRPAVD